MDALDGSQIFPSRGRSLTTDGAVIGGKMAPQKYQQHRPNGSSLGTLYTNRCSDAPGPSLNLDEPPERYLYAIRPLKVEQKLPFPGDFKLSLNQHRQQFAAKRQNLLTRNKLSRILAARASPPIYVFRQAGKTDRQLTCASTELYHGQSSI